MSNWKVDDAFDIAGLPAAFLLPALLRKICQEWKADKHKGPAELNPDFYKQFLGPILLMKLKLKCSFNLIDPKMVHFCSAFFKLEKSVKHETEGQYFIFLTVYTNCCQNNLKKTVHH